MTLFQWIALTALGLLALRDLLALARREQFRRFHLVRLAVWCLAAAGISFPNLPQHLANSLGIGRGADIVLYVSVLASLVGGFYFYSCYLQVQQQVTHLVRHLALLEAQRGGQSAEQVAAPVPVTQTGK
jgi:hypothetical protein